MFNRCKLTAVVTAVVMAMALALLGGLATYAPAAAQDLVPKTSTYEIEAVGLDGLTLLTTVNYPEGKPTPFEIQLTLADPDDDRLEVVNLDWEGSGTCENSQTTTVSCTGTITDVTFAFRYVYPIVYTGNHFGIALAEDEPDGADFTGILKYPDVLSVAYTSQPPTAQDAGQLTWDVGSMVEFGVTVAFMDPRVTTTYLPYLAQ